jgi:hypothetical protein
MVRVLGLGSPKPLSNSLIVSSFVLARPISLTSSPSRPLHRKPWNTLCGFPPTADTVSLRIPNGSWRPDTVITDTEGNEMFVLLDQTQEMRSYEAVFGDLDGRRLVCVKRHLVPQFWRDGYYFCTYQPNYTNQPALSERDCDNKKVYPFSYLQVNPLKGRFFYRYFDNQMGLQPPVMKSENPWLGFMVVCATPLVRSGKWTAQFKRARGKKTTVHVDQWRNVVDVGAGNDLLAALCMAYVFDRYQCQPLITVFGRDAEDEFEADDKSIASEEDPMLADDDGTKSQNVKMENMPGASVQQNYHDQMDDASNEDQFEIGYDEEINLSLPHGLTTPEQAPPSDAATVKSHVTAKSHATARSRGTVRSHATTKSIRSQANKSVRSRNRSSNDESYADNEIV